MDKRFLVPTPLGKLLIETLLSANFGFIDYTFTRELEERLDDIAEGRDDYGNVVGEAAQHLRDDVRAVVSSGKLKPRYACPCGKAMRRVRGKTSGSIFWSCSGYREGCTHVMDDKDGTPVERISHPCPDCSQPMYRRRGEYGFYWGCSAYRSGCKCILLDDKGTPGQKKQPAILSEFRCVKCDKPLIRRRGMTKAKQVKGKKVPAKPYDFYGCSGYPLCDGSYETNSSGEPTLT